MTQISHVSSKDIHKLEKIGKICLPIYYAASDLLFLLFDNNYVMFKITNSENKIMGFIVAKKKFHQCQPYEDDDSNDMDFFNKSTQPIIRYHIMSIGVLPRYRKKGYASLLIKQLKKHIQKKHNYSIKMSLFVLTNNEAAIKLYEKNKFRKIFCNENYYDSLPVKSAYYYET